MTSGGKLIRIFISSTFSDLKQEREALHSIVFPRLRTLCDQLGVRFQPVDLRWGVSEEAGRDQQTMAICLEEVRRSQRVSPRPNFLVLLGQRYGWRALPAQISATEFEQLEQHLHPNRRERLSAWYRRDDNAVPATYRLQPRTGPYADSSAWAPIEYEIRQSLLAGVTHLPAGSYDPIPYLASAIEQEIIAGALSVADAREHVHCFFRTIDGLPEGRQSEPYLDLTADGRRDDEAAARLDNLKQRLRAHVPDNIHEYHARFVHGDMTTSHIAQLCEDVYACLAAIIEKQVKSGVNAHSLGSASAITDAFGEERRRHFQGRGAIRQMIREYLAGSDPHPLIVFGPSGVGKTALLAQAVEEARRTSSSALIITRYIGATAESPNTVTLLQSICQEIIQRFQVDMSPVDTLYRGLVEQLAQEFVTQIEHIPDETDDVTAAFRAWLLIANQDLTTNLRDQMVGLFSQWLATNPAEATVGPRQVISIFARRLAASVTPIPSDARAVAAEFSRRLALGSATTPLMVLLDALDQTEAGAAPGLDWLPTELPPYARLVATTLEDRVLTQIRDQLPEKNLARLEALASDEGARLLDLWLQDSGRILQPYQRDYLLARFAANGLPLYLRLAFEEARRWASYSPPSETVLPGDISGIATALFGRLGLEANHGSTLVHHALGYLAAAKEGLSEDELLEVLSDDTHVMESFRRRSPLSPATDRLPIIIWSRLYFDLEPYLAERVTDGATTLVFYHRQLAESASDRFLSGDTGIERHVALARYFLGPSRSLGGSQRNNPELRQLAELPFQQTKGKQWWDLSKTLTDVAFLESKASELGVLSQESADGRVTPFYSGISLLQDDFALALSEWPTLADTSSDTRTAGDAALHDRRTIVESFASALAQEADVLARNPELLWQQCYNRLQWARGPVAVEIADVFRKRALPGGTPWLRLCTQPQESKDAPRVGKAIHACAYSRDGRTFLTASDDFTLKVRDSSSGNDLGTLIGPQGVVRACAYSPDGTIIAAASFDDTLRLWDARTMQPLARFTELSPLIAGGGITGLAYTLDGTILLTASEDGTLRLRNAHTGTLVATITQYKYADHYTSCALSPGNTVTLGGSGDGTVDLVDIASLHELTDAKVADESGRGGVAWTTVRMQRHAGSITRCVFSPDGETFLTSSHDRTVRIWDASSGLTLHTLTGHSGRVTSCCYSPDGAFVYSTDSDRTLRVWDVATGQCRAMLPLSESLLCVAAHPSQPYLLCCGEEGAVYQAELMCVEYAPLQVTALRRGDTLEVQCPACSQVFHIQPQRLGDTCTCPSSACSALLQVNPFVAVADPRPLDTIPPYDPSSENPPLDGTPLRGPAAAKYLYQIGIPVVATARPGTENEITVRVTVGGVERKDLGFQSTSDSDLEHPAASADPGEPATNMGEKEPPNPLTMPSTYAVDASATESQAKNRPLRPRRGLFGWLRRRST